MDKHKMLDLYDIFADHSMEYEDCGKDAFTYPLGEDMAQALNEFCLAVGEEPIFEEGDEVDSDRISRWMTRCMDEKDLW